MSTPVNENEAAFARAGRDAARRGSVMARGGGQPMASSLLAPAAVDYPSSDGRPMAESDFQLTPLSYARDALRHHFRDRDDVYVSGNLLIYYEEGNPDAKVAPDVFVVARRAEQGPLQLSAVAGAQGARLRAGDHLAQHVPRGPGEQAGAVPQTAGAGVLAVRSDQRLPGAVTAGAGAGNRRVSATVREGVGGRGRWRWRARRWGWSCD